MGRAGQHAAFRHLNPPSVRIKTCFHDEKNSVAVRRSELLHVTESEGRGVVGEQRGSVPMGFSHFPMNSRSDRRLANDMR